MLCQSCGRDNPPEATFCMTCAAKLDSHVDETPAHGVATSADFVGRQRELGELVSALDDAMSGKGRLVMLVGEPGVGKTRIAQELAAIAEQRGAQVLWGRCYEGEGAPPYWPWLQTLRAFVQHRDADVLASQMGIGASYIAEILPEIRQKLPDLGPPSVLEPAQARFRLFDSITAFLKNVAGEQPTVLILDNLHWADTPSLLLLEFLVPELESSPLLVMGTYRDVELTRGHPLARSLGELSRQRSFHRISIRGLTQEDVGAFIEAASDIVTRPELVEAIYSRSEGNPLFVEEMVRLISEEEGKWSGRIPEGIREVIGRRLDRLSEECNQALTVASVIGNEFSLDLLGRLVEGLSKSGLLVELEAAQAIGVIEEIEDVVGHYSFSHALIQQTLISELSTTRRVGMHARIAETLEELYGEDVETHASKLAYHFSEAQTFLGTDKLVRYSMMAGKLALDTYAWEEAQAHFERALAAKESSFSSTDVGQGVDHEMATMLFGLGRALLATCERAQAQEAVDTLRCAFDAFVDLGDTENAVAAATHRHGFLPFSSGTADMAARALDIVPPDSLESGSVLTRYGSALSLENRDYEGAHENLDRAVEIARREGDRVLEVRALVSMAQMHWVQGHYRESAERFLPVIELAQSLDELDTLANARVWCAGALLAIGDGNAAQLHATAGLETAERIRNRIWLTRGLGENSNLAILQRRVEGCSRFYLPWPRRVAERRTYSCRWCVTEPPVGQSRREQGVYQSSSGSSD